MKFNFFAQFVSDIMFTVQFLMDIKVFVDGGEEEASC